MQQMLTSHRMEQVQAPVIPIVARMIADHPGTISLGQGVVYYPPPQSVKEGLDKFLSQPQLNAYQNVGGIPELRSLIWQKLEEDNGIKRSAVHQLMVTAGGNMAFAHALWAIADIGDEIIIPTPFYFNHEMAVDIAGSRTVPVPTRADFQLDIAALARAITPRTKAIVTVSPNNPTGVVYPEESLQAVNALCSENRIFHIHDEAYEYFTYPQGQAVSPGSFEGSEAHTISLFSLSKSYGFASWRVGYMLYPISLHESMRKIQDTHLICPPVVAQYAASAALEAGKAYVDRHLPQIERNRDIFLSRLVELGEECEIPPSQGAFYFLLKLNTSLSPMEVVERLIAAYKVAAIPGDTFGITEGCYIRIAYGALSADQAEEGIGRLVKGLKEILI